MNIYLISQNVNTGYDTFDSAVVTANTEEEARIIKPSWDSQIEPWDGKNNEYGSWCDAKDVKVKLIGKSDIISEPKIICSSFNAG